MKVDLEEAPIIKTASLLEEESEGKCSMMGSVFNLSNCAIGCATLLLPKLLQDNGLILGVLLVLLLAFSSFGSLYLIGRIGSSLNKKITKYSDLIKEVFGFAGEMTVAVFMILLILGTLIAYYIFIGQFFISAIPENAVTEWYADPRFAEFVILMLIIWPLTLVKNIGKLAIASYVCLAFIFYTCFLIVIQFFIKLAKDDIDFVKVEFFKFDWLALRTISILTSAFCSHTAALEIFAELKKPTLPRKTKLSVVSTLITSFVYIMVAVSGYLMYCGKDIHNIVLLTIKKGLGVPDFIALYTFGVMLALTYPLLCFPVRAYTEWAIDCIVAKLNNDNLTETWKSWNPYKYNALTMFYVFFPFAIACAQPDLEFIFSVFSALGGSIIVFIAPSAMALKLRKKLELTSFEYFLVNLNLILGVILFFGGTLFEIVNLAMGNDG